MLCDSPARADPIVKMTTEACRVILRPYKSESFPQIGVDAVDASK